LKKKEKILKIFVWSPMLSNVGTNTAMNGIAKSIEKYSNSKIYFVDVLGEFSKFNDGKNSYIRFLKINHIVPNTGKVSKFLIFFFSILSIPFLIKQIISKKPDIIISGLVGFVPSLMKYFFKNLIIINSIQGYPKFNFLRKLIWKIFYKKSDYIITMTKKTKQELKSIIGINVKKIFVIENPVLSQNIRKQSKDNIDYEEKFIFKKKVFCAIGRLTYQKNFLELLEYINEINNLIKIDFNLIIIGDGEQRKELTDFIKKNSLNNCFLLGFKNNPYKYLARSDLYISTSRWEEPGHTLLEAGYLNVPILSSNCPNGPNEIIHNKFNGLKYELGNKLDFMNKFKEFINLEDNKKYSLRLNMKKSIINYSQYRFSKNFFKILE
jgi:glycosyltransferase involved in cell wall biosynthesis